MVYKGPGGLLHYARGLLDPRIGNVGWYESMCGPHDRIVHRLRAAPREDGAAIGYWIFDEAARNAALDRLRDEERQQALPLNVEAAMEDSSQRFGAALWSLVDALEVDGF